jgi:hypothetical protein
VSLPSLAYYNGQARLLVDDLPFLILGLQWDCDSCFTPQAMNPLFPHAKRMGANTAALPVYWREVEPEPDAFDFTMVDERIRQARRNDLRLVLIWFATWKNACAFYAPDYIRENPTTYPPARDPDGKPLVSLCPLATTTWGRDRDALRALMTHLRDTDMEHTVIMVQVENEPGILGSDRCYCEACTVRYVEEGWEERYGVNAAEAFSAASIAAYIDRLAGAAKEIYPLPLYVNVWLSPEVGGRPGQDYPSGGAVPEMLDVFGQQLQHIDFVAPDIYRSGYRDFHRLCSTYRTTNSALYIAEHSSGPTGRAERNVFYALGTHGAIGFDPWAIDSPHPDRFAPPLVDIAGGEWGPQAYWLRDSYLSLSRAMIPVANAQGTTRLFTFAQEAAESGTAWAAEDCDVIVAFHDREDAARGMIIQQEHDEFLLIGTGFSASFRYPRPDGRPRHVKEAELGEFDGSRWQMHHPIRRERPEAAGAPLAFLEPSVVRVRLVADEATC